MKKKTKTNEIVDMGTFERTSSIDEELIKPLMGLLLIGDDRFDENGLSEDATEEELKEYKLWMEWMASDQEEEV